ncbi:DUF6531 domain-containing protein [Amycolatopsis sp. DG1A-15b]|uniref:DUF6531 domain-containing protein n=1 Tax=Amycolatopsis sp. DG1A-15b TaxID=3052846 RepID=UPI00255BE87F|nr:DUF6531 domain-containing protein [Amycolatopsis sp. DG1A-15b]WIX90727.1 RHS repeat-associated core domain-containing protein [Amycolatopsis sp. DG1A-15b]
MSNPLVAQKQDSTTWHTGISVVDDAVGAYDGISSGNWIEGGIAAIGAGMDLLTMAMNPVGTLISYGLNWLIEHVKPLQDALNHLAGDADQIAAYAQTWKNVGAAVGKAAQDLAATVQQDTANWAGAAADTYRAGIKKKLDHITAAATCANAISTVVEIVGVLTGMVRGLVRDMVTQAIGDFIQDALEEVCSLGLGTPVVVAQVVEQVSAWMEKIGAAIKKLINSVEKLRPLMNKLEEIFAAVKKIMAELHGRPGEAEPHLDGEGSTHVSSAAEEPHGKPGGEEPRTPAGEDTHPTEAGDDGTTPSGDRTSEPKEPDARENTDPAKDGRPNEEKCTGGDPVDLATGEMLMSQTDVDLPGVLPLVLRRTHISTYRLGRSFGRSWASTVDQRIEVDADGVCYVGADGVRLTYPLPAADGTPVLPSHGARWPLRVTETGEFTVTSPDDGQIRHFAAPAGTGPAARGLLSAITDRNGNRVAVLRDAAGTPTAIDHSGGYHVAVDSVDGRITGLRLKRASGGDIVLAGYEYDDAGRLTAVANSSGRAMRFEYDGNARITRWLDRNGHWYSYHYDHAGRVVRTDGSGGALACAIEYDERNRITTYRNSLGAVTTYHFDDGWQLVREVDPLGATTRYRRDAYGRVTAETDPLGRTTRYEYGRTGEPTLVVHPDGTSTTRIEDELGSTVAIIDPDGARWSYRRDERGNVVEETDPAGAVTRYEYDDRGHRRSETDALGNVHRVETDALGLPTAVVNPLGHATRLRRDELGRITEETGPLGNTTRTTWTVEGKPLTRTRPDGTVERWRHDPEGNFAEYSVGGRPLLSIATTHFALPVAQVNADGSRVEFGYDTELNLTTVTNAQGLVWRYEYDAAGFLVRETDFNGRVTSYQRDAAGRLVSRTNGAGETTTYHRDLAGRVVSTQSPADTMSFSYDAAGRLVSASSRDSAITLTRDALGRVVAESVNGRTVTSEYDLLGRRIRRRTPGGTVSAWEFDAAGSAVTLHSGSRTLAFGYDAAGRETARTSPAGLRLAQAWSPNDQLLSQTVLGGGGKEPVQHRTFRYRPDGNLTAVTDRLAGPRRFDLDASGRIEQVHGRRWSEHYRYDVAGNLAGAARQGEAPDPPWRYTGTLLHEAGALRYEYDPQGRVVRKHHGTDVWQYSWNAADQLVGLSTPDGSEWRYRYDALGRRIAKERHARGQVVERVDFVWDETTLAEQLTHRRSVTWDYDPASHRPLVQVERTEDDQRSTDEKFYAIVTDLVGTPTELLDEHGNVAWFSQTTVWGRPVAHGGGASTPLRFPGQYADPESGLSYNYFRYYDPESARYLSADPIGLAGGYAPHSYVPNPFVWLDPLGLSLLDVIKNGVRIVVHEYDDDWPAHAHVFNGRRNIRIGPNGHPMEDEPELSSVERQVVENFKNEIRKAVRRLGRRNQAQEREQKAQREAKAKPCDT